MDTDLTTLTVTTHQSKLLGWITTIITQPRNYSHRHQSHAAWGSGGNGLQHGNRGARGRRVWS